MATTTKKTTTAVAPKGPALKTNAVALAPEAGAVAMYEADADHGMENVDADSVAIPFLTALQKMSPQCDPDSPDYDPDMKPGMLFNTVTREAFDGEQGLLIIPCYYRRQFLRWGARKAGGGFKGAFDPVKAVQMRDDGTVVDVEGKLFFPDDNGNVNPDRSDKLSDTREHFVIIMNPTTGALQQAVMSIKSTQIKKSKNLLSQLSGIEWKRQDGTSFRPATFAVTLKLTTVPEKNDEGSWSGYRFDIAGRVTDPQAYAVAKAFHALVSAGKANVDHSKEDGDVIDAGAEDARSSQRDEDPTEGGASTSRRVPPKGRSGKF
jgi:hypothetical protein